MKKFGFLFVPLLMVLIIAFFNSKILSSGISPGTMLLMAGALVAAMLLFRPRKAATKSADAVAQEVLDDFCAEAFADNEGQKAKFHAALNDIGSNCPKAAVAKLEKLEAQCSGPKEKYAVARAAALAYRNQQDLKNAIREYNKAIVLHPTADLAFTIGDAHQRRGDLDKARDSYEFAAELDPKNPKYYSSIGTTYVGDGDYDAGMDYAMNALELDDRYPQALATMAICYGMKEDALMHQHYLKLAMANGYSEEKIKDTIKALKKRQ